MAGLSEREPSLLTAYSLRVYAAGDLDDQELDRLIDGVDDELHDDLFRLARRLERLFRVDVVAVDESGAGWIAGGLGCRPELAEGHPMAAAIDLRDVLRHARSDRPAD